MTQGAVYDAVEAIDGRYRPYLPTPPARRHGLRGRGGRHRGVPRPGRALPRPAAHAAGALRRVAGRDPRPARARPAASPTAQPAARGDARRTAERRPLRPVHAGLSAPRRAHYRPTPPNFATDPAPWVGNVRPFLVPSVEMLRVAGPNPLTSRAYARDFNEIKSVGALHSTTRTPDETDAAIWWQENAFSLYNRIFRTIAADRDLSMADSARMLAMTNLAAADAAIGCWNEKYRWNFWRPITAIREADTDGNPATTADPAWLPLFDPSTPVAARGAAARHPAVPRQPVRPRSAPPARS